MCMSDRIPLQSSLSILICYLYAFLLHLYRGRLARNDHTTLALAFKTEHMQMMNNDDVMLTVCSIQADIFIFTA